MSTALARKFKVDVTLDLTLTSGWVNLKGITDLDPEVTPNLEDSSTYDTNGWSTSEPTMMSWTLAATFNRLVNSGVYDPGQELIRAAIGQFSTAARVGVRWYDRTGGPEANSGVAIPTWKRSNTSVKNLEAAVATLTGTDIALNQNITNPYTVTATPTIAAVSPGSQNSGKSVVISGSGFTAASVVSFGGTAATSFAVINDQLITAVLPTAGAGSAAVIVTTPAGSATGFAYTRGA